MILIVHDLASQVHEFEKDCWQALIFDLSANSRIKFFSWQIKQQVLPNLT
jgi:hypothetical protein